MVVTYSFAASLIRWAVEKLVAAYEAAGRPAQAWTGMILLRCAER